MLIPRVASREIVMRHARKLEAWESDSEYAMDVEVILELISGIHEMCLTDCFGFPCGLRLAFFEDTSIPREIWIIGFRRENEALSQQTIEIFTQRKEIGRAHV